MLTLKVPRRLADLLLYALFLVLSVAAFSVTHTFPSPLLPGYPGSAMFPRLVLIAMGIICAFGLVRVLLQKEKDAHAAPIELPVGSYLAIVACLVAFAAMLGALGMEVAVFVFIAGLLMFRTRKPLLSAGAGLASVIVTYLLFVQALSVHLPLTFLPRYLSAVF